MESFKDTILNFLKGMSVKRATFIALIVVSINLFFEMGILLRVFGIYGLTQLVQVLTQGSLVLFFAVLYLKQKGD